MMSCLALRTFTCGAIAAVAFASADIAHAQPSADQVVRLRFVHSDRCLDIAGLDAANGGVVQQYECNGGPNQMVRLRAVPGRPQRFQLVFAHSNRCLDIPDSTSADVGLQQFECHGGENQIFLFRDRGDGSFEIASELTQKCLDVRGIERDNHGIVQQYNCNRGDNQLVKVEEGGFRRVEWLCGASRESGGQSDGSFIYDAEYIRFVLGAAYGAPPQRRRDLELVLQHLRVAAPDEGVDFRHNGPNLYRDHPYLIVIGFRIQPFVPNGSSVWATTMEAQNWGRDMVYGQPRAIPSAVGNVGFADVSNRAEQFELLGAAVVAMEHDNLSWPSVRGLTSDIVTAFENVLARTFECPQVLARPLPGDVLRLQQALDGMMADVRAQFTEALRPPLLEAVSVVLRTAGDPDEVVGYQTFTFCALEPARSAARTDITDAICRPLPLPVTTLRFRGDQLDIPLAGTSATYNVTASARQRAAPIPSCPVPPGTGPRQENNWTSSYWKRTLQQARDAISNQSNVDSAGRTQIENHLNAGRAVAVFFADNDFRGTYWIEPSLDGAGQLRGMTNLNNQRPNMDDEVDSIIFLVPDGTRVVLEVYEDALDTGRYDDSVVRICGSAILSNLNREFGDRFDVGMGGDEMTSFRFVRPTTGNVSTSPPPSPGRTCTASQKCCERRPGGGCQLCVPRQAQCP